MLVKLCNERIRAIDSRTDPQPNYFKIAPGEQAWDWQRQKKQRSIGIGWNDLGDLSRLEFHQVRELIKKSKYTRSIFKQFTNFLSIKKGDIIIANKGMSKIVGIGKVIGEYQYKQDEDHAHTFPVEWIYTKENTF